MTKTLPLAGDGKRSYSQEMEDMLIDLFALPLPVLLGIMIVILLAGERIGNWLGQRRNRDGQASPNDMTTVLTSVFGLLSLLLAFTFGMAVNRYEVRRSLVIDEANAIGTAHIRSALATDPSGHALRVILEDYARVRLEFGTSSGLQRTAVLKQAAAMREQLAKVGLTASSNVRSAPMGPALMDSINAVIDVSGERDAAARSSVPYTVACLLVVLAFSAAMLLGSAGPGRERYPFFSNTFLLLLLGLALTLIADLDRPSSGTIKVNQLPMRELVESFQPDSSRAR
jgi:hypothetical protein